MENNKKERSKIGKGKWEGREEIGIKSSGKE